ncbi:hypothetical protein BDP27DRAFT_1425230 [Rhodocollybia butyracea]|uniref:Uncharacterized protein n=1 Tax=Rhodocollybia butyracea TaxID=206335 RepID=A0A9P5PG55_9AGAR|nr:hypothetical protein BDP27DRAFT_1425230 [Rhodocollybia butyracea]
MLAKNVTQGMIAHLQDRLCWDPILSQQHYICGSEFLSFIVTAEERGRIAEQEVKAWCLWHIREAVEQNPELQVWIPVLREQHKVVIKVDFRSKTIGYGDTLKDFSAPKAVADCIQRWIKLQFGESFQWVGKLVVHGIQQDAISCIPGTANTIAHGIWGDKLWSMGKRMLDCVQWFVSLTPSISPDNDMEVDSPFSKPDSSPQIRPDIVNLIHPQSNVEELTNNDFFDMVMMVNKVKSVVTIEKGDKKIEVASEAVATNVPVTSSSKSSLKSAATLNSAWGTSGKYPLYSSKLREARAPPVA